MIPVEPATVDRLLGTEPVSHRSTALRHASIHQQPGLWGDRPDRASSVVWLREGDENRWEAFATGEPEPALDWLARTLPGQTIALLAPRSWENPVRSREEPVATATIRTWRGWQSRDRPVSQQKHQKLSIDSEAGFRQLAPSWALRSWGSFEALIESGLAIGVATAEGWIALAWTYESDLIHDKIGVVTHPRYRRLGLGRDVAGALVDAIVNDRRKRPIWVTSSENTASIALANSLGFRNPDSETLLIWTPG